jgi:hypothetical protein
LLLICVAGAMLATHARVVLLIDTHAMTGLTCSYAPPPLSRAHGELGLSGVMHVAWLALGSDDDDRVAPRWRHGRASLHYYRKFNHHRVFTNGYETTGGDMYHRRLMAWGTPSG